jgi:monofunctional biosynthetic peptidoglycan transglycosylase
MAKRKGLRGRLVRWTALALLFCLGTSIASVLLLRWVEPWTSAFMLGTRKDALLARDFDYANDYRWVDLEQVSPHAAIAVVAAEDQQFPFHAGFDFKSIREAIRHNARSERVRGASTISQQVAKNLFLWRGRSYLRKGLEAWFTVLIEVLWPKERILEVYLNIAPGRSPGSARASAAPRRATRPCARVVTHLVEAQLPDREVLRLRVREVPAADRRRRVHRERLRQADARSARRRAAARASPSRCGPGRPG